MSFDSLHLDFSRLYTIVNNYWHTLPNHAGKAGFGIFLSAQQFFSSCTFFVELDVEKTLGSKEAITC